MHTPWLSMNIKLAHCCEGWTLSPSPWNLALWSDWKNRCNNAAVPEILPHRWYLYIYKYFHSLLMRSQSPCWLPHPASLCQGWESADFQLWPALRSGGVQMPKPLYNQRWLFLVELLRIVTLERIYATICVSSCIRRETAVSKNWLSPMADRSLQRQYIDFFFTVTGK